MREEEGGKETRGEGGERSCKQRLDSQGATITRIKTLVPQVDTVLTEGPQLVDRWTEPGVCLLQPPTFHTECGEKKTPDIQE